MDRDAWNDRYRSADLVWSADANVFVSREVEGMPPGRVLDLAAGEGRNAIWLAERGWRATAVDWSDVAVGKAARLAEARGVELDALVADVTAYEPEPAAYDLVVLAYLQVPAADHRAVLRHAVEALAPGGTLLVVAHDRANLEGGWGGPQDPSVLATHDEVADAVGELGLAVERAERVERPVATPEGTRVALDHVVRARRPE